MVACRLTVTGVQEDDADAGGGGGATAPKTPITIKVVAEALRWT